MKLTVNKANILIYLGTIVSLLLLGCESKSQKLVSYDRVPLDTSMWSATDTIYFDFNGDSLRDIVIEYGKYKQLRRPEGILIPLVFYLNKGNNRFQFLYNADKLITLPESELEKVSEKKFLLIQRGNKRDNNVYKNTFEYKLNAVYMTHELVIKEVSQGYIDENTDQVIELEPTIDTLYNKAANIKIENYDFRKFKKKFYVP